MIKRKLLCFGLSISTIAMMMTGCQSSNNSTSESSSKSSVSFTDTTLTGQVTSVDGSDITLSIGNGMNGGGMNGSGMNDGAMGGGAMNDGGSNSSSGSTSESADNTESTDNTDSTDSTGSTNNNGQASGQNPSDNAGSPPSGEQPGGSGSGSKSGTTVTLSISDESVISVDNSTAPSGDTTDSTEVTSESSSTTTTSSEASTEVSSDSSASPSSDSTTQGTLSDIEENDYLTITFDDNGDITNILVSENGFGNAGGNMPGGSGGNGSSTETSGDSANTLDTDTTATEESYESSSEDENALRIEGSASVNASKLTVKKKSGDTSSTENSDFYGQNAGILVRDGSSLDLSDTEISTSAQGGNGIFSYGEGSNVTVSGTTITTTKDNSGGIDAAGGGIISASDLTVETSGNSSAAIRSDRGGGTVTVDGGTYTTNGTGSPSIYSTAAISVSNATLAATASEAVVVEGANSVDLTDCDLTGSMDGTYGEDSNENIHGVMLYQSMSGDADEGKSSFTMSGGSLTNKNGDLFYVTNTTSDISLENVSLKNSSDGNLLTISGNDGSRGWGTEGSNGGTCTLTASDQTLSGDITVDSISSLDLSLKNNTTYTGSINTDKNGGSVSVTLDADSSWSLSGDTYITSLDGNTENIDTNGYTLYVNGTAFEG